MYSIRVEAACVACGKRTFLGATIPDTLWTFPHSFDIRPAGWLLEHGKPHLCPSCNNEETLTHLGVKDEPIAYGDHRRSHNDG